MSAVEFFMFLLMVFLVILVVGLAFIALYQIAELVADWRYRK